MTIESFINNPETEKRWLTQCANSFKLNKEIAIDFSPYVCQVPKTIKETKIQAYIPQKIGLGPYHCFRPEFFVTERHKLTIAKNCMDFSIVQHLITETLIFFEPRIRAQYDKFLDIDTHTLCWILTIDSLYLLHFLNSYIPHQEIDSQVQSLPQEKNQEINSERRSMAQDIIMLENQIPSIVLIEIQMSLSQHFSKLFKDLFFNFCKAHSPLQLSETKKFRSFVFCKDRSPHLLDYMHQLIVNNRAIIEEEEEEYDDSKYYDDTCNRTFEDHIVVKVVRNIAGIIPGGGIVEKPLSLMSQLPWDQITGLIKKEDESKPKIEEIEIPSVAELEEIAKIKFKLTEGGIRDIKFIEEGGEHRFYLPQITLNSDSEVILRNLVAYEAATASPESSLELAEYVDFMCGIVDTPKDVNILKKANIIKDGSSLNDEEIAELFNGITKTTGKFNKKKKSDLEKAIETVNEKFDNTLRVKTYRFIKKYIYTSWKFLTLFSTVLLILLICLQVFCQVYGCSNRWFRTSS
ncbi:putative UPF0481 protein At3g02645 [Nicotiana sylvestris]|uniref:UPF0481 protein At3g02645 n=1 Tax=Nicotiana sylvestris TaxID=4096 RepID=A0A1U7V6X9_NICSY|nr:PREDICTED: putative UPF0481 protein At3g02645 [Nicotiana sylvestris]